jgi:hypothetical protein
MRWNFRTFEVADAGVEGFMEGSGNFIFEKSGVGSGGAPSLRLANHVLSWTW